MASGRAPKQWCLTKHETINSFENWRQNLTYTISLDPNFATFLVEGVSWQIKNKQTPLRGFTNDGEEVAEAKRLTAPQKVALLDLMLGQVANFCPVISRNAIIKNSTSMNQIWQTIRTHYGFQSTGAHFIDFVDFKLEADERPEDLFQRLMAFTDDNLLHHDGAITHHGQQPSEDEELTPTLENFIVLTWLSLIHKDLPKLVKQRYGTELRSRSLASIKPEISQALDSLLDELHTTAEVKIMRAANTNTFNRKTSGNVSKHAKVCPLCKQAGRASTGHYLSQCRFLPESDKKFISKTRNIAIQDKDYDNEVTDDEDDDIPEDQGTSTLPQTRRVQVKQSPYFNAFYGHHVLRITIDSGAETNMIRRSVANYIEAVITKSNQSALQADGQSPLIVSGETRLIVTRDQKKFVLEALVVDNLDVDVLAGVPFMDTNDIAIRPAKHQVILQDGTIYQYGPRSSDRHNSCAVRRTQACVVRAPNFATTIWPGDFIEIDIPSGFPDDTSLAVEPRFDLSKERMNWPAPHTTDSVGSKIRILNTTSEPQILRRSEHFCQICPILPAPSITTYPAESDNLPSQTRTTSSPTSLYSHSVQVDPDNMLTPACRNQFNSLLSKFDSVFDPNFKGYNGAIGPFHAVVNMGPVQPPQRKGHIPQYSRNKLVELQEKFDQLEKLEVFKKPEDVGIVVEYLNPSFLINKRNGGHRLVTAFADVGRYSKPQPTLMPDVNSTLQQIAKWKYIIVTDLTSAFYQIPLDKHSMKYCGVVTPFRGVRVYNRCAMGMPGSETALEELMCRILGDLLQEGCVTKLADDLYCGGNTPTELLHNWERVLEALSSCDMCLSPSKTIICPKTTVILGWIWSLGRIQASPHRVATLSTCSIPDTVKGLRSFIGAFKVLARVLPKAGNIIAPLDEMVAGRQSKDKLEWSDHMKEIFLQAQRSLSSTKSIVLPRPEDVLWIVTDGAVKSHGLGATLYVSRDGKPRLAGYFSAKLRQRQVTWIPCELEALCIAAAVKHFSPYIIQSHHQACVLTDSKPCVQAFEKLCRGEFSSSARVSTFLSTVSHYQTSIRHLSGAANTPSDFASRNAPSCDVPACQICTFIAQTEESVVRHISTHDIISGSTRLPFTSRPAWLSIQSECSDLRRTHAHLKQGTRPSKKATNIKDIKRYLNIVTIAKDGLLVVKRSVPLAPPRECIVVPRQIVTGILTALHLKLNHPSIHQMKTIIQRYFYALDMDKSIEHVTNTCHQCASLKQLPHTVIPQSTGDPPASIGIQFAADVIKRNRQLVFVLRECVTSYTSTCIIPNEQKDTLREALIRLCIELRPLNGPIAVIRTDPAPGFQALINDQLLQEHRLSIEVGRIKNPNKNPVAERAVQEVEAELLRQDPNGGAITPLQLSIAVARLNSRIRKRGLSAREMFMQRDEFTNDQLPISDRDLIQAQYDQRVSNHPYSESAKAPRGKLPTPSGINVGDLVYINSDRNKSQARDRYLVTSLDGGSVWCNVRKFAGSQLRNSSYRIKLTECYRVPDHLLDIPSWQSSHKASYCDLSDTEEGAPLPLAPLPPKLPDIPPELAEVAIQPNSANQPGDHEISPHDDISDSHPSLPEAAYLSDENSGDEMTIPRRSSREKVLPKYLNDYIMK